MDEFKIPQGYIVWCHICAKPPHNKTTVVDGKTIPGIGFKTLVEQQKHEKDLHRVWKG